MQELQKLLKLLNKTMKIGIFDPYLDTLSGGEKYILTAALCLANYHKVSLLWDTEKASFIRKKARLKFDIDLSKILFEDNIFSPKISFFSRLLKSRKYDLILYLSDGSIPTLLCDLILHFQTPVEWVNGRSLKTQIKLKKLKKIICNSDFTKGYIDKKFQVSSKVIYPPVSIPNNLITGEKENIILNVGRFGINNAGSSYKKQEVLIDIFKKMVDEGLYDWSLRVVVSLFDKDEKKLQYLIKKIKDYPISLVVNPDNKILWENYSKSKIYWHASGFGEDLNLHPDRAEHFGISTVEAMGAGVVPVVIRAGGQKEIVREGVNGFLWNTMEEIIHKTLQLIKNDAQLKKLSRQSIEDSKNFSEKEFCNKILTYIT